MESSASLPRPHPLPPLPPPTSPLPSLLLPIAQTTLLCQSYRGLEWAWSSVKCIRNNSGRLSTPLLLLPCGSTLQLLTPSHPLSPTAASYQSLILSPHSSSSSSPSQDYRGITTSSLSLEISIVCRPHQPLTHHKSLRNSAADQFDVTQYIRAVHVVWWK